MKRKLLILATCLIGITLIGCDANDNVVEMLPSSNGDVTLKIEDIKGVNRDSGSSGTIIVKDDTTIMTPVKKASVTVVDLSDVDSYYKNNIDKDVVDKDAGDTSDKGKDAVDTSDKGIEDKDDINTSDNDIVDKGKIDEKPSGNSITISKGDLVTNTNQEVIPKVNIDFSDLPHNYEVNANESIEKEIFNLVNKFRLENGVQPLVYSQQLTVTARYKSNSMIQLEYFSHYLPNHENKKLGYLVWDVYNIDCSVAGENIFKYVSKDITKIQANYIVQEWKNSSTHREAMLSTKYTKIGIGVIYRCDKRGIYATQHFSD